LEEYLIPCSVQPELYLSNDGVWPCYESNLDAAVSRRDTLLEFYSDNIK